MMLKMVETFLMWYKQVIFKKKKYHKFLKKNNDTIFFEGDDCVTCSMIRMGSSVSYADNSCPQCGRRT